MNARYQIKNAIRVVTAASLFDGHDAAINIMRRMIQAGGAEVIHLGHNRSAAEVATAALQEDAQAIALSSYQGGHIEYFKYIRKLLDDAGGAHIQIFGGGGGVIVPDEIADLHKSGINRIYSPEDGRVLGLTGIIDHLLKEADYTTTSTAPADITDLRASNNTNFARLITLIENAIAGSSPLDKDLRQSLDTAPNDTPVLGITGTGGAGKSSLTDELIRRYLADFPEARVGLICVDPTRRRTGGALLGDRIRMNAISNPRVFMRSLATRENKGELSAAVEDVVRLYQHGGLDLIIVETSGIGQGDADVTAVASTTLYVMTPEFGAPTQLEKIDMLDFADLVAINKFEKRGGLDALRDVRKQVQRNRTAFDTPTEKMPVYGTIAARFADGGVDNLYLALLEELNRKHNTSLTSNLAPADYMSEKQAIIPPSRNRYLAEIAKQVRDYHHKTDHEASLAHKAQSLALAADAVTDPTAKRAIETEHRATRSAMAEGTRTSLDTWKDKFASYQGEEFVYQVRGRDIKQPMRFTSLAQNKLPRISLPTTASDADIVRFSMAENTPGSFPFTGGVFPLKRKSEEPKRMFAGEGGPARTNKRFHLLCEGEQVHRLSTAFDSVTLYGEDPAERPDIFGKVGESGVSVPHVDDICRLYEGFDLCAPTTSVSMTINGPAPIILAMYFNAAIRQQEAKFQTENGRSPNKSESAEIKTRVLSTVRGTVQADILKEDQAQNTCIFSTEFAMRMMGDVQSYFVDHNVRNFYSVSISGYHIAEAGANPISQLAFTLSNGFTFVEYYRSRGLDINDFGPNLSFFFSNGLDPEYAVIGRVARRIWAIAMRDIYGADERAQKLKYHIQTSGRSLHAREIQFNDIRTTLQALLAIQDHCNSLHTNAFDEAITTPTEDSVRRAMAIQLIINREFGSTNNENALQGSYYYEALTDIVEEAVLKEFERLSDRGGVLGAMELQYQRTKIQEESLYYETKKHDGTLPIVGINTFLNEKNAGELEVAELRRATNAEKMDQIDSVRKFKEKHTAEVGPALAKLQKVALSGGNIFEELMEVVNVATLGQITEALYSVGGEYRRNM